MFTKSRIKDSQRISDTQKLIERDIEEALLRFLRRANTRKTELASLHLPEAVRDKILSPRVFFSYAWEPRGDGRTYQQLFWTDLQTCLEAVGLNVWFDGKKMILNVNAAMQKGIENSDAIILMGTKLYAERTKDGQQYPTNVRKELDFAMGKYKAGQLALFPILFEGSFSGADATFSKDVAENIILSGGKWITFATGERDFIQFARDITQWGFERNQQGVGLIPGLLGLHRDDHPEYRESLGKAYEELLVDFHRELEQLALRQTKAKKATKVVVTHKETLRDRIGNLTDQIIKDFTGAQAANQLTEHLPALESQLIEGLTYQGDQAAKLTDVYHSCGNALVGKILQDRQHLGQIERILFDANRSEHARFFKVLYLCLIRPYISPTKQGADTPLGEQLARLNAMKQPDSPVVFDNFVNRINRSNDHALRYWFQACINANVLLHEQKPIDAIAKFKKFGQVMQRITEQKVKVPSLSLSKTPVGKAADMIKTGAEVSLNLARNLYEHKRYFTEQSWHQSAFLIRICAEHIIKGRGDFSHWCAVVHGCLQFSTLPWQTAHTIGLSLVRLINHPGMPYLQQVHLLTGQGYSTSDNPETYPQASVQGLVDFYQVLPENLPETKRKDYDFVLSQAFYALAKHPSPWVRHRVYHLFKRIEGIKAGYQRLAAVHANLQVQWSDPQDEAAYTAFSTTPAVDRLSHLKFDCLHRAVKQFFVAPLFIQPLKRTQEIYQQLELWKSLLSKKQLYDFYKQAAKTYEAQSKKPTDYLWLVEALGFYQKATTLHPDQQSELQAVKIQCFFKQLARAYPALLSSAPLPVVANQADIPARLQAYADFSYHVDQLSAQLQRILLAEWIPPLKTALHSVIADYGKLLRRWKRWAKKPTQKKNIALEAHKKMDALHDILHRTYTHQAPIPIQPKPLPVKTPRFHGIAAWLTAYLPPAPCTFSPFVLPLLADKSRSPRYLRPPRFLLGIELKQPAYQHHPFFSHWAELFRLCVALLYKQDMIDIQEVSHFSREIPHGQKPRLIEHTRNLAQQASQLDVTFAPMVRLSIDANDTKPLDPIIHFHDSIRSQPSQSPALQPHAQRLNLQWQQRLLHLTRPKPSSKHPVAQIQWLDPITHQKVTRFLSPALTQRLFKANGELHIDQRSTTPGHRSTWRLTGADMCVPDPTLQLNSVIGYLKAAPYHPFRQMHYHALTGRIIDYGNTGTFAVLHYGRPGKGGHYQVHKKPHALFLSSPAGRVFCEPAEVSQSVSTHDLHTLNQKGRLQLNWMIHTLEPTSFTQAMLISWLLTHEDDQLRNLAFDPMITPQGSGKFRIVSFDTDTVFGRPWTRQFGNHYKIHLKSLIFCLDQMRARLDKTAIERFMQLDGQAVIKSWLVEIENYGKGKNQLPKGIARILYTRWERLKALLILPQEPEEGEENQYNMEQHYLPIDHLALLERLDPILGDHYRKAHESVSTKPHDWNNQQPWDSTAKALRCFTKATASSYVFFSKARVSMSSGASQTPSLLKSTDLDVHQSLKKTEIYQTKDKNQHSPTDELHDFENTLEAEKQIKALIVYLEKQALSKKNYALFKQQIDKVISPEMKRISKARTELNQQKDNKEDQINLQEKRLEWGALAIDNLPITWIIANAETDWQAQVKEAQTRYKNEASLLLIYHVNEKETYWQAYAHTGKECLLDGIRLDQVPSKKTSVMQWDCQQWAQDLQIYMSALETQQKTVLSLQVREKELRKNPKKNTSEFSAISKQLMKVVTKISRKHIQAIYQIETACQRTYQQEMKAIATDLEKLETESRQVLRLQPTDTQPWYQRDKTDPYYLTGLSDAQTRQKVVLQLRWAKLPQGKSLDALLDILSLGEYHMLNLQDCKALKDIHLTEMAQASPALEILNISGCAQISNTGLAAVAQHCLFIKRLSARALPKLDVMALNNILIWELSTPVLFPQLTHLDISNCTQLWRIKLNAPSLRYLIMQNIYQQEGRWDIRSSEWALSIPKLNDWKVGKTRPACFSISGAGFGYYHPLVRLWQRCQKEGTAFLEKPATLRACWSHAIKQQERAVIDWLLESGWVSKKMLTTLTQAEADQIQALYGVVGMRHHHLLQTLLESKANPALHLSDGRTPLYLSVVKGYHKIAQSLLAAKATPNQVYNQIRQQPLLKKLPDLALPALPAQYLDPAPAAEFQSPQVAPEPWQIACQAHHQAAVKRLLHHVVCGEVPEAENLLKQNPELARHATTITDLSNRTFTDITAFQYAFWAMDWHMWRMIFPQFSSVAEARAQVQAWDSHPQHGGHYDFEPLLAAYAEFEKNWDWMGERRCNKYFDEHIGGAQQDCPAHVIIEYTTPDRNMKECTQSTFTETVRVKRRAAHGVRWWGVEARDRGKIRGGSYHATKFRIIKTQEYITSVEDLAGGEAGWACGRVQATFDHTAINLLSETRQAQLTELRQQLQVSKPEQTQFSAK